jgi:2-polyprenyl-6-methoxyphenol hydroxylase-like FAD-dependent oxidoreductase
MPSHSLRSPAGKSSPEWDLLIVGAGPTGLVLASEASRHGLNCRIIDQAERRTEYSKALIIQPRTLDIFRSMKVIAEFLDRSQKLRAFNPFINHRLVGQTTHDFQSRYPQYPLILGQDETERILERHLVQRGLQVERDVSLIQFEQNAHEVAAAVGSSNGKREVVRARWMVGCDGAHSTVRRGLNLPFEGSTEEEEVLIADIRVRWALPEEEGFSFLSRDQLLVFVPMKGEGRYRLFATFPSPKSMVPRDLTLEVLQRWVQEHSPIDAELSEAKWITRFRFQRRIVPRMQVGRIFLAGDAAHVHSPVEGHGMNTGIQDAYNLGWKLGLVNQGICDSKILESFHEERHPIAKRIFKQTHQISQLFLDGHHLKDWIWRFLYRYAVSRPWIQSKLGQFTSELNVHYRKSEWVHHDEKKWGLNFQAGDYFPHFVLTHYQSRQEIEVFEWIHQQNHACLFFCGKMTTEVDFERVLHYGTNLQIRYPLGIHVALVAGGGEPSPGNEMSIPVFLDPTGSVHQQLQIEAPSLIFVRPDGYIAYRGILDQRHRVGLFRFLSESYGWKS